MTPINLRELSIIELQRLAHETHCGPWKTEDGHTPEVQFATCPHRECVAIREAMDAPKEQL